MTCIDSSITVGVVKQHKRHDFWLPTKGAVNVRGFCIGHRVSESRKQDWPLSWIRSLRHCISICRGVRYNMPSGVHCICMYTCDCRTQRRPQQRRQRQQRQHWPLSGYIWMPIRISQPLIITNKKQRQGNWQLRKWQPSKLQPSKLQHRQQQWGQQQWTLWQQRQRKLVQSTATGSDMPSALGLV